MAIKTTKSTPKEKPVTQIKSVIARQDTGTIQITFTLPWNDVEITLGHVLEEEGQKVTIPGFRKGKAPISKVKEKVPQATLIEHTLQHFYSYIISDIINIHKVKPAIYPRLEVLKVDEGQDWQVRAITCELPEFEVGDYRKLILAKVKKSTIWTPQKGKVDVKDEKKEVSKEEKEQLILKTLVENIKITIPALLTEEEVNNRLSQLLARIEKLGLQLEAYLTQVGKDAETLRKEYEDQSKNAISIELILGKLADIEGIKADETEVDNAIKMAAAGQADVEKKLNTPEQRNIVKNVLQRRTVMDSLVALVS